MSLCGLQSEKNERSHLLRTYRVPFFVLLLANRSVTIVSNSTIPIRKVNRFIYHAAYLSATCHFPCTWFNKKCNVRATINTFHCHNSTCTYQHVIIIEQIQEWVMSLILCNINEDRDRVRSFLSFREERLLFHLRGKNRGFTHKNLIDLALI